MSMSGALDEREDQAAGEECARPQMSQAALALNMEGLSYEDYFKKVDQMVELLRAHWRAEQRVKTLKVAIQLAKLLADTSQMKLYARKFKLITECLDEFGQLVHQRIHSIARPGNREAHDEQQLRAHPHEAHELAKEICRNWFLKAASIRELVPRFYIELAILKCCDILFERLSSRALADSIEEQFYAQTLRRLTRSALGLADAVVALHARAYLCRVAERLIGWRGITRESLLFELLFANLQSGAQLIGHSLEGPDAVLARHQHRPRPAATFSAGQQDLSLYFELVSSPMQSILNVLTIRCDVYAEEANFLENANKRLRRWADELLECDQRPGQPLESARSAFRLNALLHALARALPADIVASLAAKFNDKLAAAQRVWLRELPATQGNRSTSGPSGGAPSLLLLLLPTAYASLTSFLVALDASDAFEASAESPQLELKKVVLDSAEGLLAELHELEHNRISVAHLRAFKALVLFANHYQEGRLDALLGRFLARVRRGRQHARHLTDLLDIIKALFNNRTRLHQFRRLFCSRPFCQLVELLQKDEHKQEAARWILETMRANMKLNWKAERTLIADRLLMNHLVKVFGTLNESLSPLTANDDILHLGQLVVFFVDRFQLESASERLEFYSRLRQCVSNLNFVLEHLVRRALELDLQHRQVERRRAARQNFLNGCLAYALATTPALAEPATRLELYQLACKQALEHMSLSLADYLMKQIVLTLSDWLDRSSAGQPNKAPAGEQQSHSGAHTQIDGNEMDAARVQRATTMAQPNALLVGRSEAILRMLIEHQDHVDLKHKLALAKLLNKWPTFDGRARLLEMSSRLTGLATHLEPNEAFNNEDARDADQRPPGPSVAPPLPR